MIPFAIYYFLPVQAGLGGLSKPGFTGMISLAFLNLLFYLALLLMFATLFNHRLPGLGSSIFIGYFHCMDRPTRDANVDDPEICSLAGKDRTLEAGGLDRKWPTSMRSPGFARSIATITPIIATFVGCVLLVAIASWRTGREEF
jgi:hypothetical protein